MECRKTEGDKQQSFDKEAVVLCRMSAASCLLPTECKED
jgi:hypothetical protein